MSNLLIFFALPLATIIISVVLERIWKNYILVTLFAFAIFLIIAFSLGDANLLVLVIIYTLLAFIAAFLSMLFKKICKKLRNLEEVEEQCNQEKNDKRNCNCRRNTQNISLNAMVTPNTLNRGRTGTFRVKYRY